MNNINVVTKLSWIIEQAKRREEYSIANALTVLQLEIIEERSKEWDRGYSEGYFDGCKKADLTKLVKTKIDEIK